MDVHEVACPNPMCRNFRRRGTGEIVRASSVSGNRRRPRFKCAACKTAFVITRGTFMYWLRISRECFLDIVRRYYLGEKIRQIADATEVSKDTVLRVLDRAAAHVDEVREALVRELDASPKVAEAVVQVVARRARRKRKQRRRAQPVRGVSD